MRVSILVPTLKRSHVLEELVANVEDVTPDGAYTLLFVVDHEDWASRNVLDERARVLLHDGTYPQKINAGYRATDDPLVLPTADDVIFHPGWYEAMVSMFHPGVGVVGTDDRTPATADRTHATMPVLQRVYCENPGAAWGETGTVFHEGFHHNFVELETCQLAQVRGVWAFAERSVIQHLHPDWGTRAEDDTDRKGNRRAWEADEALYRERQAHWG